MSDNSLVSDQVSSITHYHSALGLLTPATVHLGQAQGVRDKRQRILQHAYSQHPERFVRGIP